MKYKVFGAIAVLGLGLAFYMNELDKDVRPWKLGNTIAENSYESWKKADKFDQFATVVDWYSDELKMNAEKKHHYKRLKHISSIIRDCITSNIQHFKTPQETAKMCSKKWV